MLDAFADGVDIRIAGAHVVADQDAAVDRRARRARARSILGRMPIASTTRSAGNLAAVGEQYRLGPLGAEDLLGLAVGEEGDAARVEVAPQQFAGGGVELALHQRRHQMHDRDRHAAALQSPRRFEAEQPAADHHRAPARRATPRSSPRHRRCRGRRARRAGRAPGSAAPAASSRWRAAACRRRWQPPPASVTRLGGRIDRRRRIAGDQPDAVFARTSRAD